MCEQTRVLPEFAGCQAGRPRVDPIDKSSSLWWRLTGPSRHARQAHNPAAGEGVYASVKPSAKRLPQLDKPAAPDSHGDGPVGMQSNNLEPQRRRSSNSSLNHGEDQWPAAGLTATRNDTLDSPGGTGSPASRSCESLEEPEVDYSDSEPASASSTSTAKEETFPESPPHQYQQQRRDGGSPIYANFPPLPCPPSPPHPSPDEQPLRFLSDHWAEYDARRIGRKFYYNFHTGQRSWKPPRRRGELPAAHEHFPSSDPPSGSPHVAHRKGPPPLPPAKKKPQPATSRDNLLSSSQDSLLSSSRDSLLSSSREDLLSSSRDSLHHLGSRSRPPVNQPSSSASLPRESTSEEPVQHNGNSKFYFVRGSRLATAYQSDQWFSSVEDPNQVGASEGPRLLPAHSIEEEETDSYPESRPAWDRRAAPPPAADSSGVGSLYHPPTSLTPKLNRLKPTPPPVLPLSSAQSDSKHARAMRTRSMILPEDFPLRGPSVAEAIEAFDTLELVTRQGTLNKTELVRAGKKQKKSWLPAYVVLTNRNLFFYRDINSAQEKPAGKNAELQINLAGAVIDWCTDKSKRRNVFQLSTTAGQKVLLQDNNEQTSKEWFDTISAAIKRLPNGLGIVMGWPAEQPPTAAPPEEAAAAPRAPSGFASRRSKKATRSKSIRRPASPSAQAADTAVLSTSLPSTGIDSCGGQSPQERKNRIRSKLKHFFVRRPTLESLQEKGIFKDEPVFGCTLAHLCEKDRSSVPRFVQECILEIERRDMTADGLYRASGNLSQVQKVRCHVNQDDYSVLSLEEDIHVLTGALKMFFRHMKEPLLPYSLFNKFLKAIGQPTRTTKLAMFRDLLGELPRPNYDTLKYLLRHLLRVTEHSDQNRMHIQNLAIVFGPTLLWSDEEPRNLALDMMQQNQVIEFLLLEFSFLFP